MTALVVVALWLGGDGTRGGIPPGDTHSLPGPASAWPALLIPPGAGAADVVASVIHGGASPLHANSALPSQSPTDRWLGPDKARHFFLSFGGTSLAFGAARTAGLGRDDALRVAAALGVAAGVWKELRDASREGETASLKDLAWDLAGIAAAVGLASATR